MSQYGPIRTQHEVLRLTALATELGYVRSPDGVGHMRPALLTEAAAISRYVALAERLGLTGPKRDSSRELPSLGR